MGEYRPNLQRIRHEDEPTGETSPLALYYMPVLLLLFQAESRARGSSLIKEAYLFLNELKEIGLDIANNSI